MELISLTNVTESKCPDCDGPMTRINLTDDDFISYCSPCADKLIKEGELELQRQARETIERNSVSRERERLSKLNIGQRYIGMTFADHKEVNSKAAKVKADCVNYAESFQRGSGCSLLMIGSPGTGKNMLSAIICQDLHKRGFSSYHTTALKLVRSIKDTWRDKTSSEQEAIDALVNPDLLVIDEIGVQFGSPTEQLFLTEVINDRYNLRRPTILISNLKMSQLTEVMGERVIDRFYDDGSKVLVFDWPSYRRQGQPQLRSVAGGGQ